MPQKNRADLYEEFRNGDIPNENDFADTIDSALNLVEDGLVSYKVNTATGVKKRFGIGGETAPECPLGIKGEVGADDQMISFTSSDASQKWNINLNPTGNNVTGFSIDDQTSGISNSRLFIDQQSEGNIGIGTVEPLEKVHVQGASSGGDVSIMVENMESAADGGWLMSAVNDNTVPERMNAFAIREKSGTSFTERITLLGTNDPVDPQMNVGVNEVLPFSALHVTVPAADPRQKVEMAENTGILLLGPIDDENLAMDSNQIQARMGEYVANGPTLAFTPNQLSLQPFGGELVINNRLTSSDRITIDSTGKVGIGTIASEKMAVNGAITVGDTNSAAPPDGTIRWSAAELDLQVWKDEQWKSLTTHVNTDGLWTDAGGGTIYYNPAAQNARVGIGISQPTAKLHVKELSTEATASLGAAAIINQASTLSGDPALTRIGLGINCSGVWSPNPAALNVGLYVSNVSGQTLAASNIAALLNGNVVIGNITGQAIVGENGTNVLAIQNGSRPASAPSEIDTSGIQIYSADVTTISGSPASAFHVMSGDGDIIKLYRQPALEPADINAPNTGNAVTDALIDNMRTRIDQLETILKTLGLLTP